MKPIIKKNSKALKHPNFLCEDSGRCHTSPFESKLLLEWGFPIWTADCFYIDEHSRVFTAWRYGILSDPVVKEHSDTFIPCWTLGRLIWIIAIFSNVESIKLTKRSTKMESILFSIKNFIKFDFSKYNEK